MEYTDDGTHMRERTIIPEGSSPEEQPETGLDVFVARQPIFSRNLQEYGYELLYRGGPNDSFDGTAADLATARVIANSFLTIGAD